MTLYSSVPLSVFFCHHIPASRVTDPSGLFDNDLVVHAVREGFASHYGWSAELAETPMRATQVQYPELQAR